MTSLRHDKSITFGFWLFVTVMTILYTIFSPVLWLAMYGLSHREQRLKNANLVFRMIKSGFGIMIGAWI